MRKQHREAIYAAEERKQLIIEWIVGLLLAGFAIAVVVLIIGLMDWGIEWVVLHYFVG